MGEWREVALGDVASSLGGLWGKPEPNEGYVEVLALRGTDLASARALDLSGVPRRFEKKKAVQKRLLGLDSIVIEASGGSKDQPVGRSIAVTQRLLDSSTVPLSAASFCKIITVKNDVADTRFVQAILDNLYWSGEIERYQTQSTGLRNLRTRQLLSDFRFALPPITIQRHITAALSGFDQLVEINQRRIELLEDVARLLYREWFVHFRFPGHETVEFADSELGPIPKGWNVNAIGEVAKLRYGKSLTAKTRRPGDIAVVSSAGIIDEHDQMLVEGPGIVIGRKGNVGSVWWVEGPFFPIDTTYYVESDLPLGFLYWLLSGVDFIDSHAAVPGLSREQAMSVRVVIPPADIVQRFDEANAAMFRDISGCRARSTRLATTRDLLLPRLVTGKLDISDIDLSVLTPAEAE